MGGKSSNELNTTPDQRAGAAAVEISEGVSAALIMRHV